jgi:hypothetical protein
MSHIVSIGKSFFRLSCVEGVRWNGRIWVLHLQSGADIEMPDSNDETVAKLKEMILHEP